MSQVFSTSLSSNTNSHSTFIVVFIPDFSSSAHAIKNYEKVPISLFIISLTAAIFNLVIMILSRKQTRSFQNSLTNSISKTQSKHSTLEPETAMLIFGLVPEQCPHKAVHDQNARLESSLLCVKSRALFCSQNRDNNIYFLRVL